MEKGTLVEFIHRNERLLAIVQGTEGKKNILLEIPSGQTYSVHPRQITFSIRDPNTQRPQDIPGFIQQVDGLSDGESLAIGWELVQDERRVLPLEEIASLLFSAQDPVALYTTYRLLSADHLFFKQKGEGYEPRPITQVKELQHQIAVAAQKEREQAEFEAHLLGVLNGSLPGGDWSPTERLRIEALERYALYGDNASDRDQGVKLLLLLKQAATQAKAFSTLVQLRVWHPHENLALRQSGIIPEFPAEVEQQAESVEQDPPPDIFDRRDLTSLHTYTIDDASTREIDDGLSWEELSDGRQRLWIHIADPTRWLSPGDVLDLEARRRGTSIYLPERVIPMFPERLATGPMSLVQGEISYALSFGVILDAEGAVTDYEIVPSRIRVNYRLTYEDADEMLELDAEAALTHIAEGAQRRYRWRTQQGAIQIGLPESDVKVINHQPFLKVIEDTPSRQLVAEMMILVGEVAALFASQHEIPVPYRQQPTPDLPSEQSLSQLPPGPVRSFALMRCMQKAEISPLPGRHAGLGLNGYSQVTSPIRRYSDLIAHFQFKAFLAEQPLPFSPEQVQQIIMGLEVCNSEAIQLERKTNRYWSLEYFRLQGSRIWRALVLGFLRDYENLALVMVDEVAFRSPMRFQRQVQLGEWVYLAVQRVDPREDVMDWVEVAPSQSELAEVGMEGGGWEAS